MRFIRRPARPGVLSLTLAVLAACSDDPVGTSLLPPADVSVTALSPTQVRVTWSAVSGASSYEIERATGADATAYSPVGTSSQTQFTDADVEPEASYRYRVTAIAGSNRSTPSNPSSLLTTPAEGPKVAVITENITADRTFRSDTLYVLSGFIKVGDGATLTIEPGTKIVGDYEVPGSSLFILRGAKIDAQGTAGNPIVFTSERPVGQRQPGDWGGLIIIGNGIINRGTPTYIEGTGTGPENPLQNYGGGTDNDDNSGILRYVRIEFAGFPVAQNEELNSLTMAAVGRGTTIEYVQVLLGLDDSFEWFGGAVDAKYLVSYEAADDHFDMSEGYIGRVQHAIAFQSIRPEPRPNLSGGAASDPQGLENDGCWAENCSAGDANRSASTPYTIPVFANFTLIGPAPGRWETTSGNIGMMLRRGTGGLYVNGVVARYTRAAISIRGQQTLERMNEGNLAVRNILLAENAATFQPGDPDAANPEARQFTLDLVDNAIEEFDGTTASLFTALPADPANADAIDWTPAAGSPLRTGGLNDFSVLPAALRNAAGTAVTPTAYRGAVDPDGPKWWQGWTYYNRF